MELLSDVRANIRVAPLLVKHAEVEMLLPAHIGDYTDFYASIDHARNDSEHSGRRGRMVE